MTSPISESRVVALIGAVQFVNVLDFMMVMPLGPDFGLALGIPTSHLGLIGGSYTAAAAVAGIAGAFFLDRFDRRKALAVALVGLALATASGALATGLGSLLAARLLAGAFGGPATAIALAIVTDVVPTERRGRAMGAVSGAFAIASVLGVPAGLELARVGGWRLPFLAVGALAGVAIVVALLVLPPLVGHLDQRGAPQASIATVVRRPLVLLSFAAVVTAVVANFALIPNLSAYLQFNLHYPREHLGMLYAVGGAISFVTMRIAGRLTDRLGGAPVAAAGCASFALVLWALFLEPSPAVPVIVLFAGFMVCGSFRFVPLQAVASKVPLPAERARVLSAGSAVQHLASAAGAGASSVFLVANADGSLIGMDTIAWFAIGTAALLPILIAVLESRIRRRDAADASLPPGPAAGTAAA